MVRLGWRRGKDQADELVSGWELPHFPAQAMRVLQLLRDDESSLADVTEALHADPGLTVRVLALVNSAGFGRGQRVRHLAQAIHLMGRSALESLVISVALKDALPGEVRGAFDPARFWRRAAHRAAAARALAGLSCPEDRSRAFTTALLQDMAVPLLAERLGERYDAVLRRYEAGEGDLHELERDAFGWDHARIGFSMCERWQLPSEMAESIQDHHETHREPPPPEHLAARLREADGSFDTTRIVEVAAALGLDAERVEEAIEAEFAQADATAAALA